MIMEKFSDKAIEVITDRLKRTLQEFANVSQSQPSLDHHTLLVIAESAAYRDEDSEIVEHVLKSDSIIGKRVGKVIGTGSALWLFTPANFLCTFVWRYLELNKFAPQFNEQVFGSVVTEAEEWFTNNQVMHTFQAFVENLELKDETFNLLSDIKVRRLTNDTISKMWNESLILQTHYPLTSHNSYSVANLTTMLETSISTDIVVANSFEDAPKQASYDNEIRRKFELVVFALRLHGAGDIRLGPILHTTDLWFGGGTSASSNPANWTPSGPKYVINSDEINNIQKTCNLLMSAQVDDGTQLGVGLRRLEYAAERRRPEDKLLDLIIALEAMVLTKNDRGGQFKLALYSAHILGGSKKEKLQVRDKIKEGYKVRNAIVHGDKKRLEKADLLVLVPEVFDIVRRVAKKRVFMVSKGEPLDWDDILFK